jgi:hypothetical protein
MEPRLGADLSSVKVYADDASSKAAQAIGARAFTIGDRVHFNAAEYAPGTKEGDRLLAHELTHVVQGQRSGIQRKADSDDATAESSDGDLEVSSPGDAPEKEADAVADQVTNDLHGEVSTTAADTNPTAKPTTIAAKLDGVGRKILRSTTPSGEVHAKTSADEQWCRSMLTVVPNLDVNAPGTLDSIETIGTRFRRIQATCGESPLYSQLLIVA